ncbi:DUF1156 domain-containing protein [Chloroflexia bacterium SDU3-3]|nr:DUF1156 domain-containing protein [Chloroflexia bacterium SDU3-3]
MYTFKKLIEVALPLEKINVASAREKSIHHGHPSALHIWWSRKPLATARAIIFAQMVDDPSAHPDLFPTEEAQKVERERLFALIEQLVQWENTTNEDVLTQVRNEIWKSWQRVCSANQTHPQMAELFNPNNLPNFHDPFAGGGSLPLEAQRLGLTSYASDLNPVAVLINKAMIEIPPKFAGMSPVNPIARQEHLSLHQQWEGAQGLAEDIRYYGQWMYQESEKRIGYLYPKIYITEQMAHDRLDLQAYVGQSLTVIAWLWARTVTSPNPAFRHVHVPLVSTFVLANKPGKYVYIEPLIKGDRYDFMVKTSQSDLHESIKKGTKLSRANFLCLMSQSPISGEYIKSEGKAGRIGTRLIAIIVEGKKERIYLSPTVDQESAAFQAHPTWIPDGNLVQDARAFTPILYGLQTWSSLFTARQLLALQTFSDLVIELQKRIQDDILEGYFEKGSDIQSLTEEQIIDYKSAISLYMSLIVDKCSDYWSSICTWNNTSEKIRGTFSRQAIPMTWEFVEANPYSHSSGNWKSMLERYCISISNFTAVIPGISIQLDAAEQNISQKKVISTDPPYYDNIGYADLSDFFYVWIRNMLRSTFPDILTTLEVPKAEELVATSYRHGGKYQAEKFFLDRMTKAMSCLSQQAHPAFPVTIYYAFKQVESDNGVTTGWETFLEAVLNVGFTISGTWPIRTELASRMRSSGSNALASSIVLVCRQRPQDAPTVTRRDFMNALKAELPMAFRLLQAGSIAPVDLAQAAIGPGMAIFTRYSKVIDASGAPLSVREALKLINEILDEVLAEQEGDFDTDTRWALAWFEQYGFDAAEYGVAETLSKAKNTSVSGLVHAGLLAASAGKVRLLRPEELPADWNPAADDRLTVWEMVHHLVRALAAGEGAAASLLATLGPRADTARELAYRLYTICERKKRAAEALAYNGLVQSWMEMAQLAATASDATPTQQSLF